MQKTMKSDYSPEHNAHQ